MDNHANAIHEKKIERTVAALRKNNFDAHYVKDIGELKKMLDSMMPDGSSCSVGGSMTLFETGIIDYIKSRELKYFDRYADGADVQRVYHDALSGDVYVMGTNAITENGELYNVDGVGNRVAALAYGPKKVIIIAGANKIVKDLDAAFARVKQYAAPTNAVRLNKEVPCAKTGVCNNCESPARLCCQEVVTRYQSNNRIAVLILPASYGY